MGEARGGVVQPHGVLLTLDEPSLRVLQVSANVTELLHRPAEWVIGAQVEGVLGQAARSALEGVNGTSLEGQPLYVGTIPIGPDGLRQPYEAVAHRIDWVLVLELEPADSPAPAEFHELYPLVRTFLGRLASIATTEELTRIAARGPAADGI
jgi:two-component system, chemotaxis family, sensor kinase Cph1